MMEPKDIYKLVLYSGLHTELRENESDFRKKIDKDALRSKSVSIKSAIDKFDHFHGILNKDKLLDEVVDDYVSTMNDGLDDEIMSSYVLGQVNSGSQSDRKYFLDCLVWSSHINDKKISLGEREILKHFYDNLDISDTPFDKYIRSTVKRCSREIKSTDKKTGKSSLIPLVATIIIFVSSIGFPGYLYFSSGKGSNAALNRNLANISYKKIYFDRYVAAGNFNGGGQSAQTGKLVLFYIKGSADIEFDLRNITLGKSKNGFKAVYNNPAASHFKESLPFVVNVNIDPKDITEVLEIKPAGLTETQAKIAGAVVGSVAAVGGSYVGGKIGASIGTATGYPIAPLVGSLAGVGVGAVGAGAAGYILTTKYLTGFKVTGAITQSKKVEILQKTKSLIAAELFFDHDLSRTIKSAFENYLMDFYKQFGVTIKGIEYTSTNKV